MTEASGSGASYLATIPPEPAGTAIQYQVITSTTDLSSLLTSGAIDALTLMTSSTSKFVVGGEKAPTPTPTPTPTPSSSPADLKVSVTDGKTSITAGSQNTHTIVVTNGGPSAVTGASVSDIFPNAFTSVTFTAAQSGGATGFTASGTGNVNDTVTMPSGSEITYTVKGKVSSAASGTLSNTAMVTAPSGTADSIKATPAAGYTFSTGTGTGTASYTGSANPGSITMGGPTTEIAAFTHN